MQFQLFLLFFFIFHTTAFFDYNSTNSLLNIELHQCNTNQTIVHSTTIIIDKIFDSCNLDCCTKNDSNQTIHSNTYQVTVQSSTNVCLGRLCYSGECDQFLSSTNMIFDQNMNMNNTTIINTIHSSLSSIPWFSFVNTTRMTWPLWRDRSYLSIRYSILIFLLIANVFLTLITSFIVIKSIRHAKMLAERKSRRYSLF